MRVNLSSLDDDDRTLFSNECAVFYVDPNHIEILPMELSFSPTIDLATRFLFR